MSEHDWHGINVGIDSQLTYTRKTQLQSDGSTGPDLAVLPKNQTSLRRNRHPQSTGRFVTCTNSVQVKFKCGSQVSIYFFLCIFSPKHYSTCIAAFIIAAYEERQLLAIH